MEEEMGRLSQEGTLKKNQSRALPRISQALHGLLKSLDEFRELESMLGLEIAAESNHICSTESNEARPGFLRLVVATLKDMVAMLVSEMEAKPEIQKLLLLIQNSGIAPTDRAFLQDAIGTKQPSCQVDTNPKLCESKAMLSVFGNLAERSFRGEMSSSGFGDQSWWRGSGGTVGVGGRRPSPRVRVTPLLPLPRRPSHHQPQAPPDCSASLQLWHTLWPTAQCLPCCTFHIIWVQAPFVLCAQIFKCEGGWWNATVPRKGRSLLL